MKVCDDSFRKSCEIRLIDDTVSIPTKVCERKPFRNCPKSEDRLVIFYSSLPWFTWNCNICSHNWTQSCCCASVGMTSGSNPWDTQHCADWGALKCKLWLTYFMVFWCIWPHSCVSGVKLICVERLAVKRNTDIAASIAREMQVKLNK